MAALALCAGLVASCTSGGAPGPTTGSSSSAPIPTGTSFEPGPTTGSRAAATPSAGEPSPAPPGGEIAFHSDPGGNDDTYLMRADGTRAEPLTFRVETVAQPVWSPDGSRLAVECCSFSQDEVMVMNADGSDRRVVTGGVPDASSPAWSPDGRRIAFESVSKRSLYVVDVAAGGRPSRLTSGAGPSWSPDGTRIAFFRRAGGNTDVFVLEVASGRVRRLTTSAGDDVSPAWSPDGRHIAFVSDRDGDEDVWVMAADGSGRTDVSQDDNPDEGFTWSPDGRRLAFVDYRGGADPHSIGIGDAEVMVVNADGSGLADVTDSSAWEGDPAWSPDGTLLAFTRRTNHAEVVTIRPDGTGERVLAGVEGEANDCCAAWRPGR